MLRELLGAANRRYLQFVSALPDDSVPRRDLDRVSRTVRDDDGRPFRGVNFFLDEDVDAVLAVLAGEFCITGLTVRRLRRKTRGGANRRE
ncbi:MAG: hypothetical protein A3K19_19975 [Lentisphaerae bacterium RIFOXYB12_FULL_65_16]|nr:MAG: hypothetical protein A3K18_07255 [Lentisphaerae bacterium RIFOXYA12_64_32]OGV85088.1 MAG: hypothetical protein A3K19_19975 [Lentisphaerae bacterium RIFOXYB12_FULL_65_16]